MKAYKHIQCTVRKQRNYSNTIHSHQHKAEHKHSRNGEGADRIFVENYHIE